MIVEERLEEQGYTVFLYENGGIHVKRDDSTHSYLAPEEVASVTQLLQESNNV